MKISSHPREVLSRPHLVKLCSVLLSCSAGGVLLLGFHRIESLTLSPAELLLAVVLVLQLAATFVVLALLCRVRGVLQ